jgi:DNA-binding transcriptional LysR family regulator
MCVQQQSRKQRRQRHTQKIGGRRRAQCRRHVAARDRLIWIGAPGTRIDPEQPVPLILYTPPGITRSVALEALEREGRAWRIVCTSGSLSGLRAAALVGLGVTLHARGLMPDGLAEIPPAARLPVLGDVAFVVRTARQGMRGPAAELAQAILSNGGQLQR